MEDKADKEKKLVNGLHKGNPEALKEVVIKYTAFVSSVIARIICHKEDCKELCQDVFVSLWENREKTEEGKLKAYLATIARNKAFSLLRKNHDELPLEEDILIYDDEDIRQRVEQKELADMVNSALKSLDTPQRELFVRHYYYGQTIKEAAEIMNINECTARSWLMRGREKLKQTLIQSGFCYDDMKN